MSPHNLNRYRTDSVHYGDSDDHGYSAYYGASADHGDSANHGDSADHGNSANHGESHEKIYDMFHTVGAAARPHDKFTN